MSRGTRPTQPQRWGRHAEAQRKEAEETGREIVKLVQDIRRTTNVYEQRVYLAEIAELGERITRLMIEAQRGVDPDP
jgi:hypothetical protein